MSSQTMSSFRGCELFFELPIYSLDKIKRLPVLRAPPTKIFQSVFIYIRFANPGPCREQLVRN